MDHYHYSRWMTVHLKDLLALHDNCPTVHEEFMKGNFVLQKSHHKFSSLAQDQVHEQLNPMVKGDGGAIGLTENEAVLKRWMVAGPEVARLLTEYEDKHSAKQEPSDRHHEQIPSIQKKFFKNVKSVVEVMEEVGNPFSETSTDLYTLHTKAIIPDSVVATVQNAENTGKAQHQKFVPECINDRKTGLNDSIPKNKLQRLSSFDKAAAPTKTKVKVSSLKTDVDLFARMYIACQVREGDLDSFFDYENHAWPPSLASKNTMHQTTKSDLMECLESCLEVPPSHESPDLDVKIVDGDALVHVLDHKNHAFLSRPFRTMLNMYFYLAFHRCCKTFFELTWFGMSTKRTV